MKPLVDTDAVLSGLKDFQRATVEHAYHRLFEASDSTRRFLVADEVGLGKTMVARGVVAKAIDRLQRDGIDRIDVVYICSNGDIAAQNVRKLDVTGQGASMASRLTLLPKQVGDLRNKQLNLIAFTPGTSFEQTGGGGRSDERILLYWLLREAWSFGDRAGPKNALQGGVKWASDFRDRLKRLDRDRVDPGITGEFIRALERRAAEETQRGERTIRERFDDLCEEFTRARINVPRDQARRRDLLIGDLRRMLAASCIEALEPDLVVLDEFQRFRHLLVDDPDNDAARLARDLFEWESADGGEHARVLMLSATPYRALTVAGDGGDDDHHEDFLATVRFLADSSERSGELRGLLRDYQRELYGPSPDASVRLREIGGAIEALLTKYIARTERIGAAGRHDAMLRHVPRQAPPTPGDLHQYLLAQDVAHQLGEHDVTELWKSAPYLLSFLDGYKLRTRFDNACKQPAEVAHLARLVSATPKALLDREALAAYDDVDPGGPRLRELARDLIDSEAWRLLWIPPALPYHQLGGAYAKDGLQGFTKRLVFSAWRAVPRAAAGLLSYLAERELTLEADPNAQNTTERRSRQRNRLQFTVVNERRTGMPALALLYPSPALAAAADPRDFASEHPGGTIDELERWAVDRVQPLLDRLPPGNDTPAEDERWYWAAPVMLDSALTAPWWYPTLAADWTGGDPRASAEDSRWHDHVALAQTAADGSLDPPLGRRPDNLTETVARLAVGSPGTLALRAIARVTALPLSSIEARLPAARVAWALRGMFNAPEATALLRAGRASRDDTFWREVLRHSIDGDLQAVLDEHAHVLYESEGALNESPEKAAATVASAMIRSLALRASRVTYSHLTVDDDAITANTERLHTAFAMRFGDDDSGGAAPEDGAPARASQLREAFNSPYWPFVLVSTSVGQEGLDFHPYCHVVVHWNLPNNPVDLEQREGRVHRYKGHAVRKNVALMHGQGALAGAGDPWRVAFDLACGDRLPTDSELVPYWIYPLDHGAAVERHILALPLSRELERIDGLRDALAVYRLAFGQARQEDVIDHLLTRLGPEQARELADELQIDLRPPTSRVQATLRGLS
ncbi:helicase [Conexibacter sp. W3-3-2]|uniref:helicase-related protein n=1 Tax=Conexibacter sp. W3-3-2 TaxID=2675227 RepID=UPI0012B6DB19|nr:helicase-related protein [Conexibacter sp. W3-3-2]MTD44886.1 helicase [Conexibacter sp. W3-3-2]